MEDYKIPTIEQCQQYGVDDKGLEIIKAYVDAYDTYQKATDVLGDYFKAMYIDKINKATTLQDLEDIKNGLRIMPESVKKVLLFRSILIKEDELTKQ